MEEVHSNEWHHVAMVKNFDLGTISLFFDGIKIVSDDYNTSEFIQGGNENYLQIGGWAGPGWNGPGGRETEFVNGLIDEVRVSNIARYDSNFIPVSKHINDSNTLGLYHFDIGGGDIVIDDSDNNNHGTINGDVEWVQLDSSTLPDWLSLDLSEIIVLPGEEVSIAFTASSENLEAGEYYYSVPITTNDPNNSMVNLPVQ